MPYSPRLESRIVPLLFQKKPLTMPGMGNQVEELLIFPVNL
jgi:hypothetical protein